MGRAAWAALVDPEGSAPTLGSVTGTCQLHPICFSSPGPVHSPHTCARPYPHTGAAPRAHPLGARKLPGGPTGVGSGGRTRATTLGQPAPAELRAAGTPSPAALILLAPAPSGAAGAALGQAPRPAAGSVHPSRPRQHAEAQPEQATFEEHSDLSSLRVRGETGKGRPNLPPWHGRSGAAPPSCQRLGWESQGWGDAQWGGREPLEPPTGGVQPLLSSREAPQAVSFLLPMGCIPKWKALLGQGTPNTCTQKGCKKGASRGGPTRRPGTGRVGERCPCSIPV